MNWGLGRGPYGRCSGFKHVGKLHFSHLEVESNSLPLEYVMA